MPDAESVASPDDSPGPLTSLHVRRAKDGDPDSVEWLVVRLSPLLVAQAAYRLGSELRALYDPEDLVQDAWLVVLPKLFELPARDGRHTPVLLKYLGTTLVYRIQNLLRKHVGREPIRPDESEPFDQVPAEITGAVTQAVRRETRDRVVDCLEELDPRDREVILLRGVEQLSRSTVAAILAISPDAVGMRYHRALQRLRRQLPDSVFAELIDG